MSVQPGLILGPRAPAALWGKGTKPDASPVLAFGPISVWLCGASHGPVIRQHLRLARPPSSRWRAGGLAIMGLAPLKPLTRGALGTISSAPYGALEMVGGDGFEPPTLSV